MDNLEGTTVKGYELRERIRVGGFGAVYKAYQFTVGREVAVKVILPEYANQPDFIRRFETEAQLVARLEHIHIVPLYDYWRDPDGAYLVMRYLRGGSLMDALKRGPYDLESAALLLDQMASALTVAHRNNVIHRDIKPPNILLDEDGNAYLTDFGIAKVLAKGEGALADPSTMIGSPDYLAPEQARMQPVTPQTDIYNLGVVLYEMLTAEHPFPGVSPVVRLSKHLTEPIPEVKTLDPEVSEAINDVIQKATAKDPEERYKTAHEMAMSFREAAALAVVRPVEGQVEMLTPREYKILNYIAEGKSNREIAADIPGELATVKWHISQIYRKLNVRSRMQAVVRAQELDLIGERVTAIPEVMPTGVIVIPEPENPYKGLRPFQPADEQDFFGREMLVERLLERLGEAGDMARFLAVVGPSGSGKSSLVKAGLIPALWCGELPGSERWYVIDMMPGTHPLDELEVSLFHVAVRQPENLREQLERDARGLVRASQLILPDDESDLLLVIDQFEEVFTLVDDEDARTHFLDLLYTAATDHRSRVRVLITLRADFYDRPLHYPKFGELVRSRTETVLPLSAEELERAILGPAERVGVYFEEGLMASIVSDVQHQPGSLPLLQYALTELFEARVYHKLTLEGYQSIGGAVGALASRAEGIYTEMDEVGREAAHRMFMRLVTLGEGVEDTRRRVPRPELLAIADDPDVMDEVIDTYTAYRLLSLDNDPVTRNPTVELAHEAVLREWERLREWVNQARDDIRMQHRLGLAAKEWRDSEQDQSYLLRGTRLEQFEAWETQSELVLTPEERTFLDASLVDRRERRAAEAERQAHEEALEQRSRRFLRALAGVLAIAAVVAVGLAAFALNQRKEANNSAATATVAQGQALFEAATAVAAEGEAQRQRTIAEQEARAALEAYSLSLAANARQILQLKDPITALSLALAATDIEEPPALTLEILSEVAYSPGPRHRFDIRDTLDTERKEVNCIAISPDGRNALVGLSSEVILFDPETGTEIRRMEGHRSDTYQVTFNPGGKTALSASSDTVILWDLTTGQEIRRLNRKYLSEILAIDFSPDGLIVATAGPDSSDRRREPGELILWDVETGQEIRRCTGGHRNAVFDVVFSPNGRTMLASSGFRVEWWHTANLPVPSVWERIPGVEEFDLILWDVDSCEIVHRFETEDHDNVQLAIGPDGDWALTGSTDHNMYLWDLRSGEKINSLEGHRNPVITLAVSNDGRSALSGDAFSYQLILWDLEKWEPLKFFKAHIYTVGSVPDIDVAISPDGRRALSSSLDGTMVLWDLVDPREIQRFEGHTDIVADIAFSPDGQYLLSGSGRFDETMSITDDNTIRLWDLETGEQVGVFEGHDDGITSIAISSNGRHLLSGSGDRSVRLWDIETRQEIRSFEGHGSWVTDVAFISDGFSGLSGSDDGSIIMWGLERGRWLQTLMHPGINVTLAISPDGQKAFSGGSLLGADQNFVWIWDMETGSNIDRFWGHEERGVQIGSMAISPDGNYVISGDSSGNLIQWDATSVEEMRRLSGHNAPISDVSINADGSRAFSCDEGGTSILWDLATGESVGHFGAPEIGGIVRCALSPDGRLAAVSVDETIILWQLDMLSQDELLDWIASNRYVRELSCEERELYRIEPLCD